MFITITFKVEKKLHLAIYQEHIWWHVNPSPYNHTCLTFTVKSQLVILACSSKVTIFWVKAFETIINVTVDNLTSFVSWLGGPLKLTLNRCNLQKYHLHWTDVICIRDSLHGTRVVNQSRNKDVILILQTYYIVLIFI